jgi:hypothetical protein
MVARYNVDGTPDDTFGPAGQTFSTGVVQLEPVMHLKTQPGPRADQGTRPNASQQVFR